MGRGWTVVVALALGWSAGSPLAAQSRVTTPRQQFGFSIGDDYRLVNYAQLRAYWAVLARETPRVMVEAIGQTAEGRPQLMAIITAPENHRDLARYQQIARRLALAEGVSDTEARALASEGKAVVWIDGGLHADEVLGAQQLLETVYQLASATDEETLRILKDVIVLAVQANPDGMDLVSDWYMREPDTLRRSTDNLPRLYQKYIGHDNNRDFYMVAQPETENMARIMFREWFPQIVYNHHQTGPAGTVMFAPPFRDPFNYNFDPLIPLGIDMVGAAMHSRFVAEGKPGTTMRSGSSYSTWWNGGLRTVTYFHNMIGLLTETIGNPTPVEIPFLPQRQLPRADQPYPVEPQRWRFRQSIDYSLTANRAVLDYASRYRETLLYNIYLMGRNSIERGSRDSWTMHPRLIDQAQAAARAASDGPAGESGRGRGVPLRYFREVLRDPAQRDPRGYVIPSDQPDFLTATKFANALIKNAIVVHRAARDFEIAGQRYPAGSYVVKTAQPFRPHILDMFEPQDHPNDFAYPGGPPIPPYDNAGWTLAFQMGVRFDRILEGFDGPFERIEGLAQPPAGQVANAAGAVGFLLSHRVNDGFIATNRLLKAGAEVYWTTADVTAGGKTFPPGTVFIPATSATRKAVPDLTASLGLAFVGSAARPAGLARVRPVRIGLWDRYGGSMPSGWTRWLLERFEFPFEVVYAQTLDQGNLAGRYDVLIFVNGAIPVSDASGGPAAEDAGARDPDPASIPPEYRAWLGRVSVDRTVPQLRQFLEAGGTIITIGTSTAMAQHAGLPVTNHLVDGQGRPLARDQFYLPGSVLQVRVDSTVPLAYGLPSRVDVFFNASPAFRLAPGTDPAAVRRVAWYDSDAPLRSGWAWGQRYLKDGLAVAEADVGRGKLYLIGPEILNRGQPHGAFKFFFNAIYLAGTAGVGTPGGLGRGR